MKKITFFVRLLVFTIFFVNTGIISELSSRITSDKKVNLRNIPIAQKLCVEIAMRAREQVKSGIAYSPKDYFRDISQILRLEDSLSVYTPLPSVTAELQEMLMISVRKGVYTYKEITLARESLKMKGNYFQDEFISNVKHSSFSETIYSISLWFLEQYILGLIPALFLILLWAYEKNGLSFLKNPLSILLSLISYPVFFSAIFFQWTRERGREMYAETQLRRTKDKFLSILSEDEVAAIRLFAQSNLSLDTWNVNLSSSFRRSFVLVFIAFILCSLSITRAFSETQSHTVASYETVADSGGSHTVDHDIGICMSISVNEFTIYSDHPFVLSCEENKFIPQEFIRKIEHIPLSGLLFLFFNLNNSIINNKEKGNESCLYSNRNHVLVGHHYCPIF